MSYYPSCLGHTYTMLIWDHLLLLLICSECLSSQPLGVLSQENLKLEANLDNLASSYFQIRIFKSQICSSVVVFLDSVIRTGKNKKGQYFTQAKNCLRSGFFRKSSIVESFVIVVDLLHLMRDRGHFSYGFCALRPSSVTVHVYKSKKHMELISSFTDYLSFLFLSQKCSAVILSSYTPKVQCLKPT